MTTSAWIASAMAVRADEIMAVIDVLANLKGRLFIIGSGGGAGHASHAVCDFRKLCNIEAYAPTDNVSELTARINDDGWETSLSNWLAVSRLSNKDCLFVISVGGGALGVSENIIRAINYAKSVGAKVIGIVGRDGGYTKKEGDAVVVIPEEDPVTALTEGFQSVVWHCIVNHPKLLKNKNKW